ncbi:MAG: cob(I)yrinic acid a,c-diamide adenosyltransferase [Desulfonatronovibrionaceae bacterium]
MILIYTGNGKGKTSAAVGQAVRASGSGLRVAFGQFLKRPGQAGEQKLLAQLLGQDFLAAGKGFFRSARERHKHRQAAVELLQWAREKIPDHDLVVLDESIYALQSGLITTEELQSILDLAAGQGVHLVLTGRNTPDWLAEKADTVSEITEIKHHFQTGLNAVRGIEY